MAGGNWFSTILSAFASLFGAKPAQKTDHSPIQHTRVARRMAGHWPVWVELSKTTREQRPPRPDSMLSLRFSASDGPLLRSLKIQSRDFEGSYVEEKKAALVQLPERLVEELMRGGDNPVYVEAFLDGETLGSRKFDIPLRY
ncbi:hypothetical protein FNU76_10965 [Chitinimonas arctica]|uniref:Uncharacterized protein n=1 Tax=Chitinimonas arctica TaxID=2594795 RepID=A0A516SFA8_9NEIS|nr:hypothetical protein [Chitinimonas arctica]QDQ26844.1 hypothetical protein FNU76_10965 [Chitinimonas arctica]